MEQIYHIGECPICRKYGRMGLYYSYNDVVCIYERIFDETKDEWSNEYYLTPINSDSQNEILNEWDEWCDAISVNS